MFFEGSKKHKDEIISWEYEEQYSFYNIDESVAKEVYKSKVFIFLNDYGVVEGFFCIGEDAQVPALENIYDDSRVDIGFGLRPDLTDKGLGKDFVISIIKYIEKEYNIYKFRLTVAIFNKRAIKLYKKIGFIIIGKIYSEIIGQEFYIMELN